MAKVRVRWSGPTGYVPTVGMVTGGDEYSIEESLAEKFIKEGIAQKLKTKNSKKEE